MQGDHWPFILIQKQKADVAVDHGFYIRHRTVGDNTAEASGDFLAHRHVTDTAFRLGFLNHILHLRRSLQLMVNLDALVAKLDIRDRQSAEL